MLENASRKVLRGIMATLLLSFLTRMHAAVRVALLCLASRLRLVSQQKTHNKTRKDAVQRDQDDDDPDEERLYKFTKVACKLKKVVLLGLQLFVLHKSGV